MLPMREIVRVHVPGMDSEEQEDGRSVREGIRAVLTLLTAFLYLPPTHNPARSDLRRPGTPPRVLFSFSLAFSTRRLRLAL